MPKDINQIEFVIFDTETTGLSPEGGDRIVELAAMRVRGKEKLADFQTMLNPDREISEAAFNVNHISAEMLKDAPRAKEVMPRFMDFIQGACLCSYNAGFDLDFLNNELTLAGRSLPHDLMVVDILNMARRLLPGLERYALWFVAQALGIKKEQEHRALSDVKLTLSVFDKLKNILAAKNITDFASFSGLFSINAHFLDNVNNHKLAEIQEAINLGVKLKIRYLSTSSAEVTEREVIPKEIRQENKKNYLVGFCSLRQDERTFRVDNILELEMDK